MELDTVQPEDVEDDVGSLQSHHDSWIKRRDQPINNGNGAVMIYRCSARRSMTFEKQVSELTKPA